LVAIRLSSIMRPFVRHSDRQRLAAGAVTLAVHLFLGALLLSALTQANRGMQPRFSPAFVITDVSLAPPPPPPPSPHRGGAHKSSSLPPGPQVASAPELAPSAPVIIPAIVPPTAIEGAAPAGGGPGGNGGGGGGGTGNGSGGRGSGLGGDGMPPERIGGRIRDRDYPRVLSDVGVSGTVSVRYRVGTDGRASDCRVTRSSGSDALDSLTCSLIVRRFRFRPARDGEGQPVPSTIIENHSWIIPAAPSGEGEGAPYSQR